jgi:hypothetical protein
LWAQTAHRAGGVEPESIVQFALRRIRFKIGKGQLEAEAWYQRLNEEAREQYRQSGRVLVQGLARYLSSKGSGAISEAHSLGYKASFGYDPLACPRCGHIMELAEIWEPKRGFVWMKRWLETQRMRKAARDAMKEASLVKQSRRPKSLPKYQQLPLVWNTS